MLKTSQDLRGVVLRTQEISVALHINPCLICTVIREYVLQKMRQLFNVKYISILATFTILCLNISFTLQFQLQIHYMELSCRQYTKVITTCLVNSILCLNIRLTLQFQLQIHYMEISCIQYTKVITTCLVYSTVQYKNFVQNCFVFSQTFGCMSGYESAMRRWQTTELPITLPQFM